jgi:hypothetical protein
VPRLRPALVLLLGLPALARAGVSYEFSVAAIDPSNVAPVSVNEPVGKPVPRDYFVDHGEVRVGGAGRSLGYLFKDRTMFVIDTRQRTVHVLKSATTADFTARYANSVKQLDAAVAAASPEDHAEAQRKADDMRAIERRLTEAPPRDFRVTVRFEKVDGHDCRIWEERENGVKRLEFCVAPLASVAGGTEIWSGLQTLSRFREGAQFAFGVDLGVAPWWPDIAELGGIPLAVRVFDADSLATQIELHSIETGIPVEQRFDLPEDFAVQDGPEFVSWYLP